jgi:SAM-dependent methyltransferase
MQKAPGSSISGSDPRKTAFSGNAAILYASECVIGGEYKRQAYVLATFLESLLSGAGGIRGKTLIDLGCGFGTVASVLAAFSPRRIAAVDQSSAQIELLRLVLLSDADIGAFLEERGAPVFLPEIHTRLREYLEAMRLDFQTGVFRRIGGKLDVIEKSVLDLRPEDCGGRVDGIAGGNVLHWLVRERSSVHFGAGGISLEQAQDRGMVDSLIAIASLLKPGGVLALAGPKDFLELDDDPERERDLTNAMEIKHPAFRRFHRIVNEILLSEYGITRAIPEPTGLYRQSRLVANFEAAGLRFVQLSHHERTYYEQIEHSFLMGLPMLLGGIDLTIEQKLEIGMRVRDRFLRELIPSDLERPYRTQAFVMTAVRL